MRPFLAPLWLLSPLLLYGACQGKLFSITVQEEAVTTVPKATLVEVLLGDFGFGSFVAMDLTQAVELQNQGVSPGDIEEVYLRSFELEALSPDGADLAFIDDMALYVEARGLPRELVAWADTFGAGEARIPFEIEDLDLTDYVLSEAMTFTTEVNGRRPPEATDIAARFAVRVGVTGQGACNQAKR